ncbi:hypothetical protein AUEXF2481DRAFT_44774 [Aureobasidium subglaciale EXF-2481]|uniref:Uncharacterized protein n=1 Tax=Aureobasidium subglaciale (strain EXF-2481) TaxID=1043005 RepID=A0A074XYU8_AURSE|nr:uncharacterized protein AUEXF2481DRAFT_44774 [Aureobasidium subglaciale EXF-2481]KEQ90723.1 hypothetical protein AUEXF2481DRAFT_44774 [Aureobasidium subglaciale EXF-2481]
MSHPLAVSVTVSSRKILATLPLRFRNLNLWQKACSILCQRHSRDDSFLSLIKRFPEPCVSSASVNKEKEKSSTPSKWKSHTKSNHLVNLQQVSREGLYTQTKSTTVDRSKDVHLERSPLQLWPRLEKARSCLQMGCLCRMQDGSTYWKTSPDEKELS